MNPIAERIRRARIKAKMSEKELGKKCGLSPSYIIQIESGKKIINEANAEKILAVFGEKIDEDHLYNEEKEEAAKKVVVKKKAPEVKPAIYDIEPNAQWEGAIGNIIRKFPVKDIRTNKVVDEKQLPVLSKKIDGVSWDKLLFVRTSDKSAEKLNIGKDYTVWISKVDAVFDNGIYLVNFEGKDQIKKVRKLGDSYELYPGASENDSGYQVPLDKVKIIGKCIKVEFNL